MFSKEIYKNRRDSLKEIVKNGIIVLPGHDDCSINFKHNHYHFRQDSNFLYFVGISKPGLTCIIDVDNGNEYLFGDDFTIDEIIWTGPQPPITELADRSAIGNTNPIREIQSFIQQAINSGQTVHFTPPYKEEHNSKLSYWTGYPAATLEQKVSVGLIKAIVSLRSYKSAEEVKELEKAVDITGAMHMKAMQMVRSGMRESDISGRIHGIAESAGGHLSFPIILTRDGQTLHNHYHGNILKEGDMVLCDAGAETEMGYAGDMTRTFPVSDRFTDRQREIYDVVIGAHMTAVNALKPGIKFLDVHLMASKKLVEGLSQVGLMKGDPDEAVNAGAHTMFFQCGLGHMMGLDVHDMENLGEQYVGYTEDHNKSTEFGLKSLRLGRSLEEGFVITVEPGIYIIPELIDLWKSEQKHSDFINYHMLEQYRDFGGIRVEEDFLITSTGSQLLGNPVAKTSNEIEHVRKSSLQHEPVI